MDAPLTSSQFEASTGTEDWRVLARGADAWFAAPSMTAAAALLTATADDPVLAGEGVVVDVALRGSGVRVTLRTTPHGFPAATVPLARRISALAAAAGLEADPSVLRDVQLTIDTAHPETVIPFWADALGYERAGAEDVVDPLRRNPPIWFQEQDEPRPLRNRLHLDALRPDGGSPATRERIVALSAGEGFGGPFGVCLADHDGNEVDVVPPQDAWAGRPEVEDWVLLFGAMAHYPTGSPARSAELAAAAAGLADAAGVELAVDLRPEGVIFDSGKDGWEIDERFAALAASLQEAARSRGHIADPGPLRFVQVGMDVVDVPRAQAFWRALLGYVDDPRRELGVTDVSDPFRWGPTLFFQDMDPDDAPRLSQRNRTHVDLYVPADEAEARVAAAVAAGGRVVRDREAPFWVTVVDPEGNEVDVAVTLGREEVWGTEDS